MRNFRRWFNSLLLAITLLLLIAPRAFAIEDSATDPAVMNLKVVVDPANGGEAITGEVRFHTLKLQTKNATHEFGIAKVASVIIDEIEGDTVRATVELTDHTRMAGQLLTPEFALETSAGTRTLKPNEMARMVFQHPKDMSLIAAIVGLLTLTLMEIVLGIDNIIFIAIVAAKLPEEQQPKARRIGLAAALVTRLLLLASLSFILGLSKPLFHLPEMPFLNNAEARSISWRDLILFVGGLFLIAKSTMEMREKIEHAQQKVDTKPKKTAKFAKIIVQIAILDIIFSLDSVITAVGMVNEIWIMVVAMILAVGIMVAFAEPISRFVDRNPTIKVLALSFLILIGVLLVAEGLGQHMNKGYIYFAMAFSVVVEIINMKLRPRPAATITASTTTK